MNMNAHGLSTARTTRFIAVFCGAISCLPALVRDAVADERPNIIYIMSDDMGFSDIGCYGSEIETPHLDALADGGVRFTQFYNTARCCPTRASLLTGLYPHQAGVGHMMNDRGHDGYRGDLGRDCVTIPEALKSAGYRSYMSGKWHVTKVTRPQGAADKYNWPRQRGFDRFYGTIHGAGSFYDPNSLTRDNTYISPADDPEYRTDEFYYTDAISDHAVRFIREHESDEPFFMYVAYTAAHWPMHAKPRDIAKYQGRYDAGYEAIRTARYQKMLRLGVIDAESTHLWRMPEEWHEKEYWEWDKRNMEVYAAMIDSMDQGIGRIVRALQDKGQFDNTLICFFQDNGGCAENYGRRGVGEPRAKLAPLPPLPRNYLQPDMQPKQTRDGYPVRTGKGVMAGPADTYIGYGRAWATVSNTPFREYKHWTHEGGISTPLIMHWPRRITRRGDLEHTPGHLIDLMATAVDVAKAEYPQRFHDTAIQPMEGTSLIPAALGETITREALYWEHEGNRAIRVGDYKLVAKGKNGPWELYNIARDRSEQHDLSQQEPERVRRMSQQWQAYAERARVLPLDPKPADNRSYNRKQRQFKLVQGASVDQFQGPFVKNRHLMFSATVEPKDDGVGGEGVIAAQGGVTHGWAVFMQKGVLTFAVTTHGERATVSGPKVTGRNALHLTLSKDGRLDMTVNGEPVISGRQVGRIVEQPLDGLQIGRDDNGNVGDYKPSFPFQGKISNVVLTVQP